MKCKGKNGGEQHEIMAKSNGEAPKFCGDCGADVEAPMAKSQCTACDSEIMAKANGELPRHCGECGAAVTTTVESLDAVAAEMAAFAKARVEGPALPVLEDVEIDDEAIDAIMAKAQTQLPNGDLDIDAMPVVEEMLRAERGTQAFMAKSFTHINDRITGVAGAQALMLKAFPAMVAMLKSVSEEVGRLGGKPAGRRTPPAVIAGTKTGSIAAHGGAELAGDDLMAKCVLATEKDAGVLSSNEVSAIEGYTAAGFSLGQIRAEDPGLGSRIDRALATITH